MPEIRRIEGRLRDNAVIQITVWEVPGAFVWPQVGETWTVHRTGGAWMLGSRLESLEEDASISDLVSGAGRLDANVITTRDGRTVVALDFTTFDDDDIPVWDAITARFLPVAFPAVPEVTTLPNPGTDGQIVDLLVDSVGTYGGPYLWRVRYRSATSGTSKWHVIGGSHLALDRESTSNESSYGIAGYANMVVGTLVIPFAGDYWIEPWTNGAFHDTSGSYGWFSYKIGAAAASDLDALQVRGDGQNQTLGLSFKRRKTGIAAGTVLQPQSKATGAGLFYPTGNAAVAHGLRAYPIRLGP